MADVDPHPSSRVASTAWTRRRFVAGRRFAPYAIVQALTAVVDHLVLGALVAWFAAGLGERASHAGAAALLPGLALVLPFVLLSATGGGLADRLEPARLIRWIKAAELPLALLAIVALVSGRTPLLVVALVALGCRAALFGPVKLAILPRLLAPDERLDGVALTIASTLVAILAGAMLGARWIGAEGPAGPVLSWAIGAAAAGGALASLAIPATAKVEDAEARVRPNPASEWLIGRIGWREARARPAVWNGILGISWFWAFGAILLAMAPAALAGRVDPAAAMAALAAGVLAGALLAMAASRRLVEIGLVPLGAFGMAAAGVAGWFAFGDEDPVTRPWAALAAIVAFGASAGLYVVPLHGLLVTRVPWPRLGRAVAANNILNALLMLIAAGVVALALDLGVAPSTILLGAVVAHALVATYVFALVPEFLLRLLAWLLANVLYRLEVHGRDRIPAEGPLLIVCNHVSYMDAIILLGAIPRPTRFVMYWKIFDQPLMKWVFRAARAIPIAGRSENPELMEAAFATVRAELDAGEVVGIFPEGGLTRDGAIAPFRPGVERILASNPVPVVPMALRGLWGSLFSRRHRYPIPRRFRARIALVIGEPVPPGQATAAFLEQRVRELRGDWA
jgi:1-acyl-sn-glycerol-3-phosphate acyltransferase